MHMREVYIKLEGFCWPMRSLENVKGLCTLSQKKTILNEINRKFLRDELFTLRLYFFIIFD